MLLVSEILYLVDNGHIPR